MKANKTFLYYVFGVLSGILIIPIIEDLLTVIQSWIQVLLVKPSRIVMEANKELAEDSEEEYQQTNCIGFHVDSEEYYDEDDE